MVSVLAYFSDDPSSNPDEVNRFFGKNVLEKNGNKPNRDFGLAKTLKKLRIKMKTEIRKIK